MSAELIKYLSEFVTKNKNNLFQKNIQWRTRYLTVVLEDIYQPHNASAVLRTCDCFGIQDVHIIENQNEYNVNPDIALGSNQWLTLNRYNSEGNNTVSTIKELKKKGYRIIATTPHTNDTNLNDFDLNKGKAALCFGTEQRGLSNTLMDLADEFVKIPMYGFTESFNISVSAAIILSNLTTKLHNSKIKWQLSEDDKNTTLINWYRNTIKDDTGVINNFKNSKKE